MHAMRVVSILHTLRVMAFGSDSQFVSPGRTACRRRVCTMHTMRVASILHTSQVMALGNPCCLPRGEKRREFVDQSQRILHILFLADHP
jgi:hypothetical protein